MGLRISRLFLMMDLSSDGMGNWNILPRSTPPYSSPNGLRGADDQAGFLGAHQRGVHNSLRLKHAMEPTPPEHLASTGLWCAAVRRGALARCCMVAVPVSASNAQESDEAASPHGFMAILWCSVLCWVVQFFENLEEVPT